MYNTFTNKLHCAGCLVSTIQSIVSSENNEKLHFSLTIVKTVKFVAQKRILQF